MKDVDCRLCLVLMCLAVATLRAAERPNVIVILTDDQGWGDLSCHGNLDLQTPHLDSLAQEGASFRYFYVCPVCSPTRAEYLTGHYHLRHGVVGVSRGWERLDPQALTLADAFHQAGYATAAFGKWHNGTQFPYHPLARGFDEFYGFTSGHWGHYFDSLLDRNGELTTGNGYTTDDFTDQAMAFIKSHAQQPFFVHLAYNTPHSPMQVPDRWWRRFAEKPLRMHHQLLEREQPQHQRAALAMCENIDWNVGRLLAALEERDLAKKTIVVFFSDNGPNGYRYNGQLKGIKGSTDEGGIRSPLFIRWPDHIRAGLVVEQPAAAIDLFPTLAELVEIEAHPSVPFDGRSLVPLLDETPVVWPDRPIFSTWNHRVSVRRGVFRLDPDGRLFHVVVDPGQTTDIASEYPEVASGLHQKVSQFSADFLTPVSGTPGPCPIGHPAHELTQLPARDARATGGIARSSIHPNCSYFTNWTKSSDEIVWDACVLREGDYDACVLYTCQPGDVGVELELAFQGSRLRGRVDVAHDPPLLGAAADRCERQESYVKDFARWDVGRIHLPAGEGPLTLRATRIPGERAIDVRMVLLRWVSAANP